MLTVISPAKTLDFDTPPVTKKTSSPELLADSGQLMGIMRRQSPNDLMTLMGISQELAELNVQRFQDWNPPFDKNNARQAVLAFKGDVYLGMEAETYTQRDFNFAQKNLRILSGLYGLLRPLDLIQPYRLEMGVRLPNNRGKDLYAFWGDRITHLLVDDLCNHRNKTLVNLASHEYFKSVNTSLLPSKLITPVFKDYSRGSYKVLGFFAKKARGSMASFIIRNRINRPADLKDFDTSGYRYNDELSTRNEWVFTRKT
ncbi:MAG: peroxide stress protein YaaA [Gammaproteobacteria bacterium]|nr:peroxide stress protein YaaA [Gammaproteobacteria bacterium]